MSAEEDAQAAALQEYFDSNRPAGYNAPFRAGWDAGRDWQGAQAQPATNDEVTAAAERLLNDCEKAGLLGFDYDCKDMVDIETVASYALEAGLEAARLRAALEWYANKSNYDLDELYSDDLRLRAKGVTYRSRPILEDEGERARAALSTPGEPES